MQDSKPSLTVITATYNSIKFLPKLVESLRDQTVKDFKWIVADGGSVDGTLDYLAGINDVDLTVVNGPDFGIYDALNRALNICITDYYLVVGSDDILYPDSLSNFLSYINDGPDVVYASVLHAGGVIANKKNRLRILTDAWSYVSSHSVGCVFKKDLHDRFGFYSNRFPICADQYFIKKIVNSNVDIVQANFVSGEFGSSGVSSTDVLGHLCETFRVQYETEKNKIMQFLLFLARLLKNKFLGRF